MLVIRIEEWPGGSADRRNPVAQVDIANVSDGAPVSDFEVVMRDAVWNNGPVFASGTVYGHRRSDGWLPLARAALRAVDPNGGFYTAPSARIPASLLPALDLAPYASRACQTARAILASEHPALAAHLAEIGMTDRETWAGEFFRSCRGTEKWTGLKCQDPQHTEEPA